MRNRPHYYFLIIPCTWLSWGCPGENEMHGIPFKGCNKKLNGLLSTMTTRHKSSDMHDRSFTCSRNSLWCAFSVKFTIFILYIIQKQQWLWTIWIVIGGISENQSSQGETIQGKSTDSSRGVHNSVKTILPKWTKQTKHERGKPYHTEFN